jgi:hypothetical protein
MSLSSQSNVNHNIAKTHHIQQNNTEKCPVLSSHVESTLKLQNKKMRMFTEDLFLRGDHQEVTGGKYDRHTLYTYKK